MNLAAIPWQPTRHPGLAIHFYERPADRRAGRVVALIRMEPGSGYPRHRHCGPERVLVLQGSYRDEFGEHGRGEFVTYEDGTTHTPIATGGGDACVLLAVAYEGIELE